MSASSRLLQQIVEAAAHEVEEFINDNFEDESFDGNKWQERKRKEKSRRRLLVKTRRLQRSIRVKLSGQSIQVVSDVPYAQIHNEGGTINHPGGTPYIVTGRKSRARGRRSSLRNFGENQAVFLKKDGSYPEGVKFTKPHKIDIPKRQYIGNSEELESRIKSRIEEELKEALPSLIKDKLR